MGTRVSTLLVRLGLDLDKMVAHMADTGDSAPTVARLFAPGASKPDQKKIADAIRYHAKKAAESPPADVRAAERRAEFRVLTEISEHPSSELVDLSPLDYWTRRLTELSEAMRRAMRYGVDGERLLVQLRKQQDEAYREARRLRGDDDAHGPVDMSEVLRRLQEHAEKLSG